MTAGITAHRSRGRRLSWFDTMAHIASVRVLYVSFWTVQRTRRAVRTLVDWLFVALTHLTAFVVSLKAELALGPAPPQRSAIRIRRRRRRLLLFFDAPTDFATVFVALETARAVQVALHGAAPCRVRDDRVRCRIFTTARVAPGRVEHEPGRAEHTAHRSAPAVGRLGACADVASVGVFLEAVFAVFEARWSVGTHVGRFDAIARLAPVSVLDVAVIAVLSTSKHWTRVSRRQGRRVAVFVVQLVFQVGQIVVAFAREAAVRPEFESAAAEHEAHRSVPAVRCLIAPVAQVAALIVFLIAVLAVLVTAGSVGTTVNGGGWRPRLRRRTCT